MTTDPSQRVYSDLVGGLLDAREDPATERFDEELRQAVQRGEVTAAAARRLRFWQRAALRALTDHTRTVLPVVLGALAASRREAAEDVAEGGAVLDREVLAPTEAEHPAPELDLRDTPEPASTAAARRPSSLGERGPRLIVAGLVPAESARPEHV